MRLYVGRIICRFSYGQKMLKEGFFIKSDAYIWVMNYLGNHNSKALIKLKG